MHEEDHGHSVAAWTGTITIIVATAVICVGIFFDLAWANWVGSALVIVGILAWFGLAKAGFGEDVTEQPAPTSTTE